MRTFTAETLEEALIAWADGGFGPEWDPIWEAAEGAGNIFPPAGTALDDRDDENPSQRSIIYRAMSDTPVRLRLLVKKSRNWSQVVAGLFTYQTELRQQADREVALDAERRMLEPDEAEARAALARLGWR